MNPSTPLPEQGGFMAQSKAKPDLLNIQGGDVKDVAQSNGGDFYSKIQDLVSDVSFDDLSTEVAMVEIARLIEKYRKQHELDARIDELISYGREVGLSDLRVKTALHERIEKLKAEREAL